MKTYPGFFEGVALALMMAFTGSALLVGLSWLSGGRVATGLTVTLLSLLYLLYLLRRAEEPIGRLTTLALWLVVTLGAGVLDLSLTLYLLTQAGFIWLVRSLYFHNGLFAALADLGLHVLALAAALWAWQQSGSIFLVLWSYFLVQALFSAIPHSLNTMRSDNDEANDQFAQSQRVAHAALRRLTTL